ncbi:MAG: Flp family type IVb pilin [Pseudomonadota bacterium]
MWCRSLFAVLKRDVAGATAIEYALIGSLIALVLVSALINIGNKVKAPMNSVSAQLR